MTPPYDIAIAGAGCAGLSFAWHLLEAGIEGKRIAVVDQSFAPRSDRLWCFWGDETAPFRALAVKTWPRATVRFDDMEIDEALKDQSYACIRSEDFQAAVLQLFPNFCGPSRRRKSQKSSRIFCSPTY